MMMRAVRGLPWVLTAVAGVAFGALLFLLVAGPDTRGTFAADPLGVPFTLVDHNGAEVTDAVFRGRPSAVMFGFTSCTDVCPTTLLEMTAWHRALGQAASELSLVFVTVDPERDTPEVLKDYLATFSPAILGITGEPKELATLLDSYRVYWRKVPKDGGGYEMDHTAPVFLLDEEGRFAGTIGHGEDRETALAKLRRLVGAG